MGILWSARAGVDAELGQPIDIAILAVAMTSMASRRVIWVRGASVGCTLNTMAVVVHSRFV